MHHGWKWFLHPSAMHRCTLFLPASYTAVPRAVRNRSKKRQDKKKTRCETGIIVRCGVGLSYRAGLHSSHSRQLRPCSNDHIFVMMPRSSVLLCCVSFVPTTAYRTPKIAEVTRTRGATLTSAVEIFDPHQHILVSHSFNFIVIAKYVRCFLRKK